MKLPSKDQDKVDVLRQMRAAAERCANPYKVRWLTNHYWLLGYRDFYRNFETGQVKAKLGNREDQNGQLDLKYEAALVKLQSEVGRLSRMDTRPDTAKRGFGLDSLRKASAGRGLLDFLTSSINHDQLKQSLVYLNCVYGTSGLFFSTRASLAGAAGTPAQDPDREAKVQFEAGPPWELLSTPHNPITTMSVEGVCRKRWVPLDWLKDRRNLSLSDDVKMMIRKGPYGFRPDAGGMWNPAGMGDLPAPTEMDSRPTDSGSSATDTKYALLEEWWMLRDERDRLLSYTVKIGDHIALDEQYKDRSVYRPFGISYYHPVGGFYGRSFIEILLPLNAAMERMAQNLVQNIEDLDLFGIMAMPMAWGVDKRALTERRTKRKIIQYQPDLTVPDAKMQHIQPANSGDTPGKTLAFISQLMDGLSNQSEMLQGNAPGRVDSQVGLSYLQETSSIPLSVPAGSLALAYADVYRAVLSKAPDLLKDRKDLPLYNLDDSILGLKVNPAQGTLTLDPANYPAPFEILVDVRDKLPVMPTVRIQALKESLQLGLIKPIEFKLTVWKENLDYPVGSEIERESYRGALLQVLFLFGDGETPGRVQFNTSADNPDIRLMVIQQFMARPEFQFASVAVRKAFEELKNIYEGMQGMRYPQQLPPPEQLAMMAQAAGGASPMGGGPGPQQLQASMPQPGQPG